MKKIILLALSLCFCASLFAQWDTVAALPANIQRHHPITFSIDGFGYSIGGAPEVFPQTTNLIFRYDPAQDSWTEVGEFPGVDRALAYGVANDSVAFVGFGALFLTTGTTNFSDLWRYKPSTDEWTELTPCPCTPRGHPAMILVDDKIFIGLGDTRENGFSNLRDWWEYSITNDSWEQKASLPGAPRHHPFFFDIDGIAYVGLGHGGGIFRDFYKFDPSNDQWTRLNDFPGEARVAGTQFSHGQYGYVLSGDGDNHRFMEEGEFWQYDPTTDSWTQLESHPGTSRWAPGSFVIEDRVYFLQGQFFNPFVQPQVLETFNDMMSYDLSPFVTNTREVVIDDNSLQVFPNPVEDELLIQRDYTPSIEEFEIRIFSTTGTLLKSFKDARVNINVSDLPAGTYMLQEKSQDAIRSKMFVKQ